MFNSKIDLFDQKWIDTIFEGRNTAYGAYDLRKRESKVMILALIIGACIFTFLVSLPLIIKSLERDNVEELTSIDQEVVLAQLPPPDKPAEITPPAPPRSQMRSIKDVERYVTPVVATAEEETEELANMDSLMTKLVGSKSMDGFEDGGIVVDEQASDITRILETDGDGIYDFTSVQVMPSYPGGERKFIEFLQQKLANVNTYETRSQLRMEFQFVINADGSLTDVEILDDGGNSFAAKEYAKAIATSRKWSPGVNNGQPVPVRYTVPVVLQMQ
jgi:protein TonB